MTKEEAAIVAAYTGYLIGDFAEMQKYIERKLNRPVWTHELASEDMQNTIREVTKQDFISIKVE